jgi:hypothetical protein
MADPSKITDNVLEAEIKMFQQAALYSQRKVFEKDFRALEWKSANQNLYKSGVSKKMAKIAQSGATSNYHKWAKEIIDYQLYGIKQTLAMKTEMFGVEIDVTNVMNKVQAFTRFSNLAMNPFVDATSATTGVLTNITDRLAKDFYAPSSASRSNTQTGKFAADYVLEASKMNKESKLNHLGEWLGLMEYESKVANSAYNRGMRVIGKLPYTMSKFSNLPIHQRNILAVLNDYRLIDGRFIDFPNFRLKTKRENKGISEREVQAMFDKYQNDSAWDFLEVDKDGVRYNSRFADIFGERAEEEFKKLRDRASNKAQQIIERSDGVLNTVDQVGAQRNVLTNALMMHKGWLPILLTKRFKKRQFNVQLGKMEEGHYTTLMTTLFSSIKGRKARGESIMDVIRSLEQDQRDNLRRAAWELGIFSVVFLLGSAVLAADDGDDDSYIEQFARLIYLRTASEYSTTQLVSLPSVVVDTAKNPIVAIRTLDAIEPVSLVHDMFGDIVTLGDGEGSKTLKKLKKSSFLKRADQLSDLQTQISAYRHFNKNTLHWLSDTNE